MYKIIMDGIEKDVSLEEAEKIIESYNRENHRFSIDEMWRTQKIIYLRTIKADK